MQTLEEQPQTAGATDETLRMIERRLDSLSELIETDQPTSRSNLLGLAGYRRSVAKEIDEIMADTLTWWQPTSV
jgi:hypothetical protein